jgi:hypothetical protein
MKSKFEMQILEPPLLAKYTPDQNTLSTCIEFGKKISDKKLKGNKKRTYFQVKSRRI